MRLKLLQIIIRLLYGRKALNAFITVNHKTKGSAVVSGRACPQNKLLLSLGLNEIVKELLEIEEEDLEEAPESYTEALDKFMKDLEDGEI